MNLIIYFGWLEWLCCYAEKKIWYWINAWFKKIKFNLIDFQHLKLEVLNFKLKQKVQYFFGVKLGIQFDSIERKEEKWLTCVLKVTALWRSVHLFQTLKVTFFGIIRIILIMRSFLYHDAWWWRTSWYSSGDPLSVFSPLSTQF